MLERHCRKCKGKADAAQGAGGMVLGLYVPAPDGYVRAADKWTRASAGLKPGVRVFHTSLRQPWHDACCPLQAHVACCSRCSRAGQDEPHACILRDRVAARTPDPHCITSGSRSTPTTILRCRAPTSRRFTVAWPQPAHQIANTWELVVERPGKLAKQKRPPDVAHWVPRAHVAQRADGLPASVAVCSRQAAPVRGCTS